MAPVNKIHSVRTIALVARELGEDEHWLGNIAGEMDPEDGLIWVYSPDSEEGVMAFSRDGEDNLANLIAIHRKASE